MVEAKKELITDTKNDNVTLQAPEKKLYRTFIYFSIVALLIGGLMDLLQTIMRADDFTLPLGISYYQILTFYGMILALVMTKFFIIGFQFSLMEISVSISDKQIKWGWISFWNMAISTIITSIMILLCESSVLYRFYTPLKAHPLFYIGL